MAHYEKINAVGVSAILAHDNRTQKKKEKHIDVSLSKDNYNLRRHPEGDFKYYKERKKQVLATGSRFNSRTVGLVSCVITLPKDFPFLGNKDKERQFFEVCCNFLDKKHGKENCVSAWVHNDEPLSKSHLHYCTMPIEQTQDKDGNDILKFNAKAIVDRSYLRTFHKDLQKELENAFGCKINILNDVTQGNNKTVKQLKEITEHKKQLEQDINNLRYTLQQDTDVLFCTQLKDIYQDDGLFFELPEDKQKELTEVQELIEQFLDVREQLISLNDTIVNDLVVNEVVPDTFFFQYDVEEQQQEQSHSLEDEIDL